MSVLELLEGLLDGRFLVGRNLVGVVLQEVLGGEDHGVCLIHLVHLLTLLLISLLVGLGLSLHALNIIL